MGKAVKSRRAMSAAFAAALVVGAFAAGSLSAAADETSAPLAGAAAGQVRFKAIKVDVSPLTENGLGPEADWMAQRRNATTLGDLLANFAEASEDEEVQSTPSLFKQTRPLGVDFWGDEELPTSR